MQNSRIRKREVYLPKGRRRTTVPIRTYETVRASGNVLDASQKRKQAVKSKDTGLHSTFSQMNSKEARLGDDRKLSSVCSRRTITNALFVFVFIH